MAGVLRDCVLFWMKRQQHEGSWTEGNLSWFEASFPRWTVTTDSFTNLTGEHELLSPPAPTATYVPSTINVGFGGNQLMKKENNTKHVKGSSTWWCTMVDCLDEDLLSL